MMSPRALLALLPVALLALACSGGDSDGGSPPSGTSGQGGTTGGSSSGQGGSSAGSGQGGAGQGGASGSGGSAGGGGSAGKIPCETTNDCVGYIPETKPAGCAKALCDADQKFCRFVAKDLDGDGDPSNSCKSNDAAVSIELGGDCDEGDDKVNSEAWDGPEGLAGGEARPERCNDGVDNDCNGVMDDGKLDSGETCKCEPGQVRQCSQDPGGKAIKWPAGAPVGGCKYGKQTCDDKGKWGACTGAVPPGDEICDALDNDCDGQTDEDDALNKKKWFWDADGDFYGDENFAPVIACDPPTTPPAGCVESPTTSCTLGAESWKSSILATDCNDRDPTSNPEAKEVCDGADNDCNGQVDEGATNVVTWYRDDDGDGFLLDSKKGQALSLKQCTPPGSKPEECPEGKAPCTNLWLKEGTANFTDCNDSNKDVHPGAWDGPAFQPRPYGIVAPGLKAEFFKISNCGPDLSALPPEPQTRTDVTINYQLSLGAIGEGLPKDIGARWTGSILIPEDGEYTFHTITDDGIRLWVGDLSVPIIDKWGLPVIVEEKRTLSKGVLPIKVEWFDCVGGGVVILQWEGPGFSKQPMTVALEPTVAQQINRCGDGLDNDCNGTTDDGLIQTKGNGNVLAVGCDAVCDPVDPDPTKNITKQCGPVPQGGGICHQGSQYCKPNGQWSGCGGEEKGKPEGCVANGQDDDCNGTVDDGIVPHCKDGDGDGYCVYPCEKLQACSGSLSGYTPEVNCKGQDCNDGISNTSNLCECSPGQSGSCGTCNKGSRTCKQDGTWGECVNAGAGYGCPPDWFDSGGTCSRDSASDRKEVVLADNDAYREIYNDYNTYGRPCAVNISFQWDGGGCYDNYDTALTIIGPDATITLNNKQTGHPGSPGPHVFNGQGLGCSFSTNHGPKGWTPPAQGMCKRKMTYNFTAWGLPKGCYLGSSPSRQGSGQPGRSPSAWSLSQRTPEALTLVGGRV